MTAINLYLCNLTTDPGEYLSMGHVESMTEARQVANALAQGTLWSHKKADRADARWVCEPSEGVAGICIFLAAERR